MKTPQKHTAKFLRLHGCQGNNNFSLTRKLLGGTWLRDARNWSLYRGIVYMKYIETSLYTSPTWISRSTSPYPNYSCCTNTGLGTSLLPFSLLRVLTHGSQPSLVLLVIVSHLSMRHQKQQKRSTLGDKQGLQTQTLNHLSEPNLDPTPFLISLVGFSLQFPFVSQLPFCSDLLDLFHSWMSLSSLTLGWGKLWYSAS